VCTDVEHVRGSELSVNGPVAVADRANVKGRLRLIPGDQAQRRRSAQVDHDAHASLLVRPTAPSSAAEPALGVQPPRPRAGDDDLYHKSRRPA
jgi:hypothetical protein